MKKLNEREIAQNYDGKSINSERLLKLFHSNGNHNGHDEHIAYCEHFNKEECDLFNITPALSEYWGYYGIEFWIYLYVDNGTVYDCKITKDKCTGGYRRRPSVHIFTPTQQEIRVFRRIMDYITT
jgi:hypothetical protein